MLCSNISDSATIAQFYGVNDSVTYNYNIDADAVGIVTGGSSLAFVLSSAMVNFHFEYCTCPPVVLPLNIRSFNVSRVSVGKAELKWNGYDDPFTSYYYEAEVSRDGFNFTSIGSLPKNGPGNDIYRLTYSAVDGEGGTYFFRVKQVYPNGLSRYSNIKYIDLENSDFPGFTMYPNPSKDIVGIKFDNSTAGHYNIQIYNSQGQMMVRKDIVVTGASYVKVATLENGAYWVKLTDVKSQKTCVNQLLIK